MSAVLKSGEVWKIDGRKGPLTIRLLEDVDPASDAFFEAEIIAGKARFMSQDYRDAQRYGGHGTAGTSMPFRTTLVSFNEQVSESSS